MSLEHFVMPERMEVLKEEKEWASPKDKELPMAKPGTI